MKYSTATVEGFIAYHDLRNHEIPATWEEDQIEASLLVASEWIDNIYGNSFIGQKTLGFLQEREWPRINASVLDIRYPYIFGPEEIPERITKAVYEAAYRDRSNPGSLMVDYTPGKYKSVEISGAVSVDYAQFAFASEIQSTYPIIDNILEILLTTANSLSIYSSSSVRA